MIFFNCCITEYLSPVPSRNWLAPIVFHRETWLVPIVFLSPGRGDSD
jgi:hypothetical protein